MLPAPTKTRFCAWCGSLGVSSSARSPHRLPLASEEEELARATHEGRAGLGLLVVRERGQARVGNGGAAVGVACNERGRPQSAQDGVWGGGGEGVEDGEGTHRTLERLRCALLSLKDPPGMVVECVRGLVEVGKKESARNRGLERASASAGWATPGRGWRPTMGDRSPGMGAAQRCSSDLTWQEAEKSSKLTARGRRQRRGGGQARGRRPSSAPTPPADDSGDPPSKFASPGPGE